MRRKDVFMKKIIISKAAIKQLHYISGITLSVFIGVHLFNHLLALAGPDAHIGLMEKLRKVYRQPVIETILLLSVLTQVISGARLLFNQQKKTISESIQIWSGMYLSFFLTVHVSAVIAGRLVEHLDTNFYFAGAGLNLYPATLFFIPYYFLSVCAISLHIASLHYLKTKSKWSACTIGTVGIIASVLIMIGYTHCFNWWEIPLEYRAFISKYFGKG
ncbi:MAG: hypothetical protein J7623_30515 [Chitinophaga sp.]|uniref:hypothetical protein n=1 Tax=Chitinophaga sp. TaxID=1869181 RepID=UPI001B24D9CF|nr:hypothetical protein [Chitinophaga sp.]MBO9733014.1 hypothetical protein [Chitinophaga sp.]